MSNFEEVEAEFQKLNNAGPLVKSLTLGILKRDKERVEYCKKIIEGMDHCTVIAVIEDEYAIIQNFRPVSTNGVEYPYTSAYFKEGKWHQTYNFSDKVEDAILCAIGHKFEGNNSRFHTYAYRMLAKE